MIRFCVIIGWEFLRYLNSRSFFVWTFLLPVFLAGIVLIPSYYYQNYSTAHPRLVGYVEFDADVSSSYYQKISNRLGSLFAQSNISPELLLQKIEVDSSGKIQEKYYQLKRLVHQRDSLRKRYKNLKKRRRVYFQRPNSKSKEQLLSKSYNEFINIREQKDLAESNYKNAISQFDSLKKQYILNKADSLLTTKAIDGYLLVNSQSFKKGIFEFHSLSPINFLRIDALEQSLQGQLIEERMRQKGIKGIQIQKFLSPIKIQGFRMEGAVKYEFKFVISYLAPIVAVLFLFVSISSSCGYLFSSLASENSSHILESLLASVSSIQLLTAKILGLGLLGLLQILLWMTSMSFLMLFDLLPLKEIGFLTLSNAGIFIIYFLLGYLFFASILIGLGSLSSNIEDAHHLNYFVKLLSVTPFILAILVLQAPNTLIIRILSFIPFLTPTFMVLRTPLGPPPLIDYYISIGTMLVSIILCFLFSGKIFQLASLIHHKKPSFKSIFKLLRAK